MFKLPEIVRIYKGNKKFRRRKEANSIDWVKSDGLLLIMKICMQKV